MDVMRTPILVIGATGRQGSAVCEALNETGKFSVFGTSRIASNPILVEKGITPVQFKFGDVSSAEQALAASDAKLVFFVTDYFGAAGKKKATEIQHGCQIIDACVKAGVEHIVFSSVADADKCPDNVEHFKSKLEIENYLKASSLSYSILRPVAYLENFADPSIYNPLRKGVLKFLTSANTKVKFVSCKDIGKAAAVMFMERNQWKGKTLDCVSCEVSGAEAAAILTEVSGVPCKYNPMLPRFIMRFIMSELEKMVCFFEKEGFSSSIDEFFAVVPSATGVKEFFLGVGKWHSGEMFNADTCPPASPASEKSINKKVAGLLGHKMFLFTSALTAGITAGFAVLFAVKPSVGKKLLT